MVQKRSGIQGSRLSRAEPLGSNAMATETGNWPLKVRDITPYLILSHTCSLALAQM